MVAFIVKQSDRRRQMEFSLNHHRPKIIIQIK